MNYKHFQLILFVLSLGSLGIVSCGDETENDSRLELEIGVDRETLWVSDYLQLTAFVEDGLDYTTMVSWSVSDESKAEISDSGKIRLKKEGAVIVYASMDDIQVSRELNVLPMHVLYQTAGQDVNSIRSVNWSDGEEQTLLTGTWEQSRPHMASDGSALVFADTIDAYNPDIFIYQFSGQPRIAIATDPLWDDQPSWSPDSKKVYFRSFRNDRLGHIYAFDTESQSLNNLTPDPTGVAYENLDPAVSPDGKSMAFSNNWNGLFDIWIYNLQTGESASATSTVEYCGEPAWSPDGKKLVFRSNFTLGQAVADLVVLDLESGSMDRIWIDGIERTPSWSPNGRFIVFSHELNGAAPRIRYIDVEKASQVYDLGECIGYGPSFY